MIISGKRGVEQGEAQLDRRAHHVDRVLDEIERARSLRRAHPYAVLAGHPVACDGHAELDHSFLIFVHLTSQSACARERSCANDASTSRILSFVRMSA